MAREFARRLYESRAWKEQRARKFAEAHGLCELCGKPGEIVHHRKPLTPANIDDPRYTLSMDNLQLVCRECHKAVHDMQVGSYSFDSEGNLVNLE